MNLYLIVNQQEQTIINYYKHHDKSETRTRRYNNDGLAVIYLYIACLFFCRSVMIAIFEPPRGKTNNVVSEQV